MKRRNFLGLMVAGAAMPLLPSISTGTTLDPIKWNAQTLAVEMEKMFACTQGPFVAFFDVANPDGTKFSRYVYQTYAIGIEGGSAVEAEARLAEAFYKSFSQMPAGKLVWRTKPEFISDDYFEYGETWATDAEIEDNIKVLADKPDDVQYEFVSGNYKHVTKSTQLHKMRMRLVMPDLPETSEDPAAAYIKQEGTAFTTRIS